MPNIRPEDFALRAINQYRKRDIFPYLGLRYYLENRCARRDRWSCEIAAHLVLTRDDYNYFQVSHFKDIEELQGVTHRSIFIPGPNEALVEVALLAECAKYPEVFGNYSCTFSYDLVGVKSREGMFKSYFPGFQQRHRRVASSCRTTNAEQVFYTDIKGFYPNITYDLALKSWREACNKANMASMFRELGEKLLLDYNVQSLRLSSGECRGVLTGPMFSHLIGNLVLVKIYKSVGKNYRVP